VLALLAKCSGARELWQEWVDKEWDVVDKLNRRDLENVGVVIVNFKNGECPGIIDGSGRWKGFLGKVSFRENS